MEVVTRSFWSFVLPLLEYCSAVWSGAATCHLSLLDRVVRRAVALSEGEVKCDLLHRRKFASLCMFYKIFNNACHPVRLYYPNLLVPTRVTRRTARVMHDKVLVAPRCRTVQYTRSFVPACVTLWGITLMALFLMVWIWIASSFRLIVLLLVIVAFLLSFNFLLFIFEWLTAWWFC